MADVIYNSFFYDSMMGNVTPGVHTFKLMLVSSGYTPNKDTHTKRSDVTNEVTGTGYTAGGATLAGNTITQDNTNDLAKWTANAVTFDPATLTARGAVLYRSRGSLASADELVKYFDFGSDKSSSAAPFTVEFSTDGILQAKDTA